VGSSPQGPAHALSLHGLHGSQLALNTATDDQQYRCAAGSGTSSSSCKRFHNLRAMI
jgi:hypothetical protein